MFSGLSLHICCRQDEEACLSVESVFYAHRARPSVIVQEIHVENPTVSLIIIVRLFHPWMFHSFVKPLLIIQDCVSRSVAAPKVLSIFHTKVSALKIESFRNFRTFFKMLTKLKI